MLEFLGNSSNFYEKSVKYVILMKKASDHKQKIS